MAQERWISATEAARLLGRSSRTLRQYTHDGVLPDVRNPKSNRRIFRLSDIERLKVAGIGGRSRRGSIIYGRVSSRRQHAEGDLDRQMERLRAACDEIVGEHRDIASGLSDRRQGLRRALADAVQGTAAELVVEHRDRLARFGTGIIEHQLELAGVRLRVLDESDDRGDPQEEMVRDLVAIITSFAGRLHGARSAKARELRLQAQRMQDEA